MQITLHCLQAASTATAPPSSSLGCSTAGIPPLHARCPSPFLIGLMQSRKTGNKSDCPNASHCVVMQLSPVHREIARFRAFPRYFVSAFFASTLLLCHTACADEFVPAHGAQRAQNRCGWYDNPTPQNAYLVDTDGEWILSEMGGHEASGDWRPAFKESDWVLSGNGGYGYGCACMSVIVKQGDRRNVRMLSRSSTSSERLLLRQNVTDPRKTAAFSARTLG